MKHFKSLIVGGTSLAITLGSVAQGLAHHSFAMFDGSQILTFTGVVTRINPDANHLQIFFAPLDEERQAVVRNEAGEPVIWAVEMSGAADAAQDGISVNNFPPGTIFSVGLHPLRNGQPGGDRGESGLFKCPENTPPAAGQYCDSVVGFTSHGEGAMPVQGELEEEYVPE